MGSPPRVRGKGFLEQQPPVRIGITPACAGKSGLLCYAPHGQGDHPRVCGEKKGGTGYGLDNKGSPPRVRGKDLSEWWRGQKNRITPACAGKRSCCYKRYCGWADHPRVCGEKLLHRVRHSSPRGITPACAGKRGVALRHRHGYRDHPRVCGEKPPAWGCRFGWWGSPPRVRGKDEIRLALGQQCRITPACAGKSHAASRDWVISRDHPRVCGEKANNDFDMADPWGSPPRVRGKDPIGEHVAVGEGITPACAGKSSFFNLSGISTGDHPRVCGEKNRNGWIVRCSEGSPPRVRGKARGVQSRPLLRRITPACAGKSTPAVDDAGNLRDHPRVCGEKTLSASMSELW